MSGAPTATVAMGENGSLVAAVGVMSILMLVSSLKTGSKSLPASKSPDPSPPEASNPVWTQSGNNDDDVTSCSTGPGDTPPLVLMGGVSVLVRGEIEVGGGDGESRFCEGRAGEGEATNGCVSGGMTSLVRGGAGEE